MRSIPVSLLVRMPLKRFSFPSLQLGPLLSLFTSRRPPGGVLHPAPASPNTASPLPVPSAPKNRSGNYPLTLSLLQIPDLRQPTLYQHGMHWTEALTTRLPKIAKNHTATITWHLTCDPFGKGPPIFLRGGVRGAYIEQMPQAYLMQFLLLPGDSR